MNKNKVSLEKFKDESLEWQRKINELRTRVESDQGGEHQDAPILERMNRQQELLERLSRQHSIIDQYLKSVEGETGAASEEKAGELDRMMKDIDTTYREALPHFY